MLLEAAPAASQQREERKVNIMETTAGGMTAKRRFPPGKTLIGLALAALATGLLAVGVGPAASHAQTPDPYIIFETELAQASSSIASANSASTP